MRFIKKLLKEIVWTKIILVLVQIYEKLRFSLSKLSLPQYPCHLEETSAKTSSLNYPTVKDSRQFQILQGFHTIDDAPPQAKTKGCGP